MSAKKRVGITGGIGAGKSLVCRIIHTMGYPVFYSDIAARDILNSDRKVITEIQTIFGEGAYKNGQLNRKMIADRVFNDQNLLNAINSIVHPAVQNAFKNWAVEQEKEIVFNEAAILFETGGYKNYDHVVLVTASIETRIERVMKRDKSSREEVLQRMEKQWPDEKKETLAQTIIRNDNHSMLIPQVLDLLNKLQCN